MYSVVPAQSSVVFVPVAAISSPSLRGTTPGQSNSLDGRPSMYTDGSVDFSQPVAQMLPCHTSHGVAAVSPLGSVSGYSDYFDVSPRSLPVERSTPLKPAKRDRAADDDDRQILRCKRSLASSLKTSRLDGGSRQPPSPPPAAFSVSESVERRNLRERRRVKLINVTFATLRSRLPSYCWQQQEQEQHRHLRHRRRHHHHHQQQQQQQLRDRRQTEDACRGSSSKRPSKVDTLRTAINYIRCLQDLLAADDDDRQHVSATTFHKFAVDAAADTSVVPPPPSHWMTSPAGAVGCRNCSPSTATASEDSTTAAAMTTFASANSGSQYTDDILARDVIMSPLPDIPDWFS